MDKNKRLHRNLVETTVWALTEIFEHNAYADKVVSLALKRDKRWGSHDRKFVAETIYDIVRWKRLYAAIADINEPKGRENWYRILAVWATLRGYPLPDWPVFDNTPQRRIKGRFDEFSKNRILRESIPDWMDELCVKELGEELWEKEIAAQNQLAEVILRTNPLKAQINDVQKTLETDGITTQKLKGLPFALKLEQRANVFMTQAFKDGLFEVQDANSQKVAALLGVKPGMKVIDACAGAGGKTLHLASLMENKGQLIALDIYEHKLQQLKLRARRNGAHNIECRVISDSKVIKRLAEKADRLLIDAPCSGLGVLKRNPDSKWKLQPEFVAQIKNTQREILESYSKMVKPGGQMVYATCSILPSENKEQVNHFLTTEAGQNFSFLKDYQYFAHDSGYDGFYMALLERKQ